MYQQWTKRKLLCCEDIPKAKVKVVVILETVEDATIVLAIHFGSAARSTTDRTRCRPQAYDTA
jgi:hypothetical protein